MNRSVLSAVFCNTYDAFGRVVEETLPVWLNGSQTSNTTVSDIGYDPWGHRQNFLYGSVAGGYNADEFISTMPGGRALGYYNENNVRGTYFEHPDALGTVTEWTDTSGNVAIGNQKFYPWGEAWGGQVAWQGDPNFAGMEHRNAEGFDVTPNRQYNPAVGRWMTPDPKNAGADPSDPQTWNAYAYAGNNPTTNTDPTGELYCGPEDENGTMPCVLDQEYFNNPDQYQGYKNYQSNYPQEQNEPRGKQEAGARSPDVDPIDIGLLAAGGVSLIRGAAGLGEGLIGLARGLFESGSREAEPLGLRAAGAMEGKALPALTRLEPKIQNQMVSRGWTRQDILEVFEKGQQSRTVDRTAGFSPATQYLDRATGRFIVVNDATGNVVQISAPGFRPNLPVP